MSLMHYKRLRILRWSICKTLQTKRDAHHREAQHQPANKITTGRKEAAKNDPDDIAKEVVGAHGNKVDN